jgi:cyclic pyranopterin phosphate synthase
MTRLEDTYGRSFKTLRVSLLSRCNLGCTYCTMGDEVLKKNNTEAKKETISPAHLLKLIDRLHSQLDLETIRLTGGEPLLYSGLIPMIEGIKKSGIPEIKLTTNGFLLEKLAVPMKKAGMSSINVSLDALDEDVFRLISKRNNVQRIIHGIDAALNAGLEVKLNTVVMKGINESQVLPLLEFAFNRNLIIRFLEIMAMGHLHEQPEKYLFPQKDILSLIETRYRFQRQDRKLSSTSNYWNTEEGHTFGIIANESEPFCHDCNRLRLDSHGNIYGCLSDDEPVSLLDAGSDDDFRLKLQDALKQKQAVRFKGSGMSMLQIGG